MNLKLVFNQIQESAQLGSNIVLIVTALFFIAFLTLKKKTQKYAK